MEKVVWVIKHVKSGLWSFRLEISLGDAPQLGRAVEVDTDQVKTLIEQSALYHLRDNWHAQNI